MDKAEMPNLVAANSNPNGFLDNAAILLPEPMVVTQEGFIGTLDIHVHHARDIYNICIYHKQDVYAKFCLTSDPEVTVSTKTINGGGRNPVFGEKLKLNVRTVDCSLKCEIWMLSRVKNYLEDQLLGFALVPLSDAVAGSETPAQEFSLSSTDLFHSPAGFVQLSLSYTGYSPEVIAAPVPSDCIDINLPDSENDDNIPCEFVKIEFPDLKVVKENKLMVSEYFGIPCDNLEPECSECLVTCENDVSPDLDAGVHIVERIARCGADAVGVLSSGTTSSASNGSPTTIPATSQSSSDPSRMTESQNQKTKSGETAEREAESSSSQASSASTSPLININVEPEQTVVQQDIIDMYMKSMQQFTESLAKMNLPMDIESTSTNLQNANSGSEQRVQATKGSGSRVFYGSSAFF